MRDNNPSNKHIYIFSNNQNYWDLSIKERNSIRQKFKWRKTDIIEVNGIIIKRIPKTKEIE